MAELIICFTHWTRTEVREMFVIADVRVLDKQKGTTKQLSYTMAVKQDLVISAYKPKESFRRGEAFH